MCWLDLPLTCGVLSFQDEPTSGVDPRARQFLWSIVKGLVSAGQSVLLTTHSMAECEALCSRVGIMVNGSFRCLGSPQQLKSTYGQGYKLKIRSKSQVEAVKEFIRQNFNTAILKVSIMLLIMYRLHHEVKVSMLFTLPRAVGPRQCKLHRDRHQEM